MNKIQRYFKRNSAGIYTGIAMSGVIGTAIFSSLNTMSAIDRIDGCGEDKKSKIKIICEEFVPTLLTVAMTEFSIFKSDFIHRKTEQAFLATALVATKKLLDVEKSNKCVIDDIKKHSAIVNIPEKSLIETAEGSTGKDLFYCEFSGRYFYSDLPTVENARYELNRQFALLGYARLNDFYKYNKIKEIPIGDANGWEAYIGETEYGYMFVDIDLMPIEDECGDKMYLISYFFPPHTDYIYNS